MVKRSESKNRRVFFKRLNSREKTLAIAVLAALLTGVWLPGRIIVSTSPSLNHRVFFLTRTKGTIENGDYLVFKHDDTNFVRKGLNSHNDHFVKKVGCSPGDQLSIDPEKKFFCEHKELGTALDTDSKGRALPLFQFNGKVPQGNYFMVGANPRSFDSRYFGFVHADEILYKVLPLW